MCDIDRRDFIRLGCTGAAGVSLAGTAVSSTAVSLAAVRPVFFLGDGLNLNPKEYAGVLAEITASGDLEPDYYSNGGVVDELERRMAEILGKERAVFLPTGTLANHLAVRLLCEDHGGRRVVTQTESHLANDAGDDCETLAGLRVVTVAPGEAAFTLEQVEAEHARAEAGRVKVGIGAISVESPVRRKLGSVFDFGELSRISNWARSEGIGLHLDGARLFMAAAYTGIQVERWADLFDTVYVSLWKYFNAGSGAVLAGPSDLLDGLFHSRRMYGGSLVRGWVYAAVALHYLDGFEDRFRRGVAVSEELFSNLENHSKLAIRSIPQGSNVFILDVKGTDPAIFRDRMMSSGVWLREPRDDGSLIIQVNETWAAVTAEELGRRMEAALTARS
jgi:threonine aldolase